MENNVKIGSGDDYLLINSESCIKIPEIKQSYDMVFFNEYKEVGRLDWNSGKLKFIGNAEESAKQFFEFLKSHINIYIENELKSGR